jgi:transposase
MGYGFQGQGHTPGFDLRAALARWAGVDITRINGLATTSVLTVLSEIGPDLSRFASVKHFCSWLGLLCPATKISGGKVLAAPTRRSANRVRKVLKLAAMSLSRNNSSLGAFYRRLCSRMDKPRANTAVAHKLARMIYFLFTRGEAYVDQGQHRYEEQQRQRAIGALQRRAASLDFVITPTKLALDDTLPSSRFSRGWSHEEENQVVPRGPGARSADGLGVARSA